MATRTDCPIILTDVELETILHALSDSATRSWQFVRTSKNAAAVSNARRQAERYTATHEAITRRRHTWT